MENTFPNQTIIQKSKADDIQKVTRIERAKKIMTNAWLFSQKSGGFPS